MVGSYGISASEYMDMTPIQVHIILESKRVKTVGGLHEDDIERIEKRRAKLEEQGVEVI